MSFPEFSIQSNFKFHLKNIKELLNDTNILNRIPNFSLSTPNHFYKREDNRGWWMATKQIVIRHYIDEYLTIESKGQIIYCPVCKLQQTVKYEMYYTHKEKKE